MLRLELTGISKQYPAVRANDKVNLQVAPGQIHAVLGENGAGKSTLMKMIYGAVRPDEGEIRWNGEKVEIKVAVARRGGMNKPISISAEDLPAGVTATAQTSAEKGDSSKEVTLVLQAAADAMPGGQAIRIVGKSEGDAAIVRTATLPRVGLVTDLTALWLTVVK